MKRLKENELVKIKDDVCIVGIKHYTDFREKERTTYTLRKVGYDEYIIIQKQLKKG